MKNLEVVQDSLTILEMIRYCLGCWPQDYTHLANLLDGKWLELNYILDVAGTCS